MKGFICFIALLFSVSVSAQIFEIPVGKTTADCVDCPDLIIPTETFTNRISTNIDSSFSVVFFNAVVAMGDDDKVKHFFYFEQLSFCSNTQQIVISGTTERGKEVFVEFERQDDGVVEGSFSLRNRETLQNFSWAEVFLFPEIDTKTLQIEVDSTSAVIIEYNVVLSSTFDFIFAEWFFQNFTRVSK